MENPHKYINVGKDAAKTLGETGGLGTVATRADIIEKLFNSFVIEPFPVHPSTNCISAFLFSAKIYFNALASIPLPLIIDIL